MKVDVAFLDLTTYLPYTPDMLGVVPMGGTESTTCRVAQGLAKAGLKVAVVQHCLKEPTISGGITFVPLSEVSILRPRNVVTLRGTVYFDQFPAARKFSWLHDDVDARVPTMVPALLKHNATVVCVSEWHRREITAALNEPRINVTSIYNPVPDSLYSYEKRAYDKNKMVWTASPHKGLEEAMPLFKELRKELPEMQLHVFNPGYFASEHHYERGVVLRGPVAPIRLWAEVATSLCVYYPTNFKETFGLIAAEANALGTPVACPALAGLAETCNNEMSADPNSLVREWHERGRPAVKGQDRFRIANVVKDWLALL